MGRHSARIMFAAAGIAAAPVAPVASQALHAQEGTAHVQLGVSAGQATDARGLRSSAVTVAPAVLFRPSPRFSADLGIQGTRFATSEWAATGAGSLGFNIPLAPWLAFTASALGAWTTTSFDARYTSLAAVPALEARLGRMIAFAGAQAAHGSSVMPQPPTGTPIGGGPIGGGPVGGATTVTTSHDLVGLVYGAGSRFSNDDITGYAGYREERSRVADYDFVDRAASLTATGGRTTFAGSLGTRTSPDDSEVFANGSLTMDVTRSAAIQLAGARYPANPLTGTLAGTALSIGMVIRTGRPAVVQGDRDRAPRIRGVAAPARGVQRLAIGAPRAMRVEIAADWNDWQPVPAVRAPDGHWYADVRLAPGRYRYAFRIDGGRWAVPDGVTAVDDGFGGQSAWLTVK